MVTAKTVTSNLVFYDKQLCLWTSLLSAFVGDNYSMKHYDIVNKNNLSKNGVGRDLFPVQN